MDQIFEYVSATSETPGQCRVRIYPAQRRTVVVISELADDSGVSITPTIEELAIQICEAFQLDPEQVRWVEHHPAGVIDPQGRVFSSDIYDLVRLTWTGRRLSNPEWSPSSREEIEQLIGEPLYD